MAKILIFRTPQKLENHFNEHKEATGCETAEEYIIKANAVINNPQVKVKIETDEGDNDKVYYLSQTGEIVFVSEDGFIRTYYIADDEYFSRQ